MIIDFLGKVKRLDWTVIFILALFMVISSFLIYSAVVDDPNFKDFSINKHLVIYVLGFFVLFTVSLVNYRLPLRFAPYLYVAGIGSLIALYRWGVIRNGAKGWFELPYGFHFQPAELMKLLIILAVAAYMIRKNGDPLELTKDVLPLGAIVFVPFLLVFLQPDLGNAVIYLVILLGMFWIGNIKYTHVLIGTALIVGAIALFVYLFQQYNEPISAFLEDHGKGHWATRINSFINPENATRDDLWQVERSRTAIASGGLMGSGYLQGKSLHNNFIPYAYSDAIFVVVGEEFGFRGSALLLVLYFILIYRMIMIAIESQDLAGMYIITGIVSMYVFQIFQNIGMLIGLMPLTGITLPFISYGGTSLLINMISLGIVLSVRIHQKAAEPA